MRHHETGTSLNGKLKHSITRIPAASAAVMLLLLAGCGAWQATRDSTVDAAQWLFTTQVKTMNVDIDARAAVNETATGQPLSTVVRFYQLKDSKTFAQLEYVQLQNSDLALLKTDLVATKDVVMRPGTTASISEPMDKDAEYVGVVAFFRSPSSDGVWKLLIPKKQRKDTDPVKIQVQGNRLAYEGAKPKPVKHDSPQQSMSTAASGVSNASSAAKAASQDLTSAADSLKSAKASAGTASRSAAGLLSN